LRLARIRSWVVSLAFIRLHSWRMAFASRKVCSERRSAARLSTSWPTMITIMKTSWTRVDRNDMKANG
jgi:hypothetical protein